MFVAERLQKIKSFLVEYQYADVSTLSAMLSVSEPTIRKDLERLEESGDIRRIYGGAVLNTNNYVNIEQLTEESNCIEKCNIAEHAARFVKEGDVIFLGHGFICARIAKLLHGSAGITIVTNNTRILSEFGSTAKCELLLTGGRVEKSADSYIMTEASADFFKNILISKAFFTVDGVSLRHGYTFQRSYLKDFYSHIFELANESSVVVESAKFGQMSLVPFMPLHQIPTVITNEDIGDEYKQALYDANVQLFTTMSSVAINPSDILSKTD